jgi:hypothetical protein
MSVSSSVTLWWADLCSSQVKDVAYATAGQGEYAYQLTTAAYMKRTDTGGSHSLLVTVQFAAAFIDPELIPEDLGLLSTEGAADAAEDLPDDALVVRGGTNTAERFANASGVTRDEAGNVYDVSVNSAPGRSLEELSQRIPNKQIGVTTVGEIRGAGGTIQLDPLEDNPFHCLIGGCTPEQFSDLFTPTIKNPWTG